METEQQLTLFPEPSKPEQLTLGIEETEKTPEDGTSAHSKSAEDMFLEDAVAFLDLQAQAAEARGAKKLAQKLFRTRIDLCKRKERN